MTILEAIEARNSVRHYTDKPLSNEQIEALNKAIEVCNKEGHLYIQLLTEEPEAFKGFFAHYGKLSGVKNYFALVGPDDDALDEALGYYGEKLVLQAQMMGLNTCWVAATFSKRKCKAKVPQGMKMRGVISLGFGKTQGVKRKSKPIDALCRVDSEPMPEWFKTGMEAAMRAPTAVHQQKFLITLESGKVKAKALKGPYSKIDLGIVKYHFEEGAGRENFSWA